MNPYELSIKFKALIAKRDESDKLLLSLMQNKDFRNAGITMSDILQVHDAKLETHERLCDAVTRLRRTLPNSVFPWNRPEYNQYERSNP